MIKLPFSVRIVFGGLFLTAAYFVIFYRLDAQSIRMWDESRNAVNALEMSLHHQYLVRLFWGSPDMWEVKPPMLPWLQITCMKLVGYNELAVRLPSALATMALIIIFLRFCKIHFGSYFYGYSAGLVLLTTPAWFGEHISRSGDHDALLCFFLVMSLLAFYYFTVENRNGFLLLTAFLICCAILTKSIGGLFYLPGFFIYAIYEKKLRAILTNKYFYIGFVLVIIPVATYYLLRERVNPGYLKAVWNGELFPRYLNSRNEFRQNDPLFYITNLLNSRFIPWIYFFPATLLILLRKDSPIRKFTILCFCCILTHFTFISFGTLNEHYDAPSLVLLALITGLGIVEMMRRIRIESTIGWRTAAILALSIGLFGYPYVLQIERILYPAPDPPELKFGGYMKHLEKTKPLWRNYTVFNNGYNSALTFYKEVYLFTKDYKIEMKDTVHQVNLRETLMVCQPVMMKYVKEHYIATEIDSFGDSKMMLTEK